MSINYFREIYYILNIMPITSIRKLNYDREWRLNNPELYKASYTVYRDNNREEVREKDRKRKMFFYQCKIFRNILI
jgi:hypothetical protein